MSAVLVVQDEAVSSSPGPREGGPRRRRAFTGRKPGEKIGRPSAEQAEIARLTRELDLTRRRLAKTEAALDLVGKAHALLEEFSERADTQNGPRKR